LRALVEADITAPGSQTRNLLAAIKTKAAEHPYDSAYAYGLVLLARCEGAGARDLVADAEAWGNADVKRGAAEARVAAAGVTDPYGFVISVYEKKGAAGLSQAQLYYLALVWLDAEVRNGGFSQYYFNSSGELAAHAVKAARAVGASELAVIIQRANDLFGKNGPHSDRDKRMVQLSKIDPRAFGTLETRYYKCSEQLGELLPRFVAANPDAFRPAK
jgi:hypothetical protein